MSYVFGLANVGLLHQHVGAAELAQPGFAGVELGAVAAADDELGAQPRVEECNGLADAIEEETPDDVQED